MELSPSVAAAVITGVVVLIAALVTVMSRVKALKAEKAFTVAVLQKTERNLRTRQFFLDFLAAMPHDIPPTFFGEPYKIDAGYVSGAYPTLTAKKDRLTCVFKAELDENNYVIRLCITFGDETIRDQVLTGKFTDNIILMHKVQNWTLCWFADKEATSKSWSEEGYSSEALGQLCRTTLPEETETEPHGKYP